MLDSSEHRMTEYSVDADELFTNQELCFSSHLNDHAKQERIQLTASRTKLPTPHVNNYSKLVENLASPIGV